MAITKDNVKTHKKDKFLWEDNLLERKPESDLKDLLKTLVAFANSVKPGHTAVLLIGEKDDGTVKGLKNPDNIQKVVRKNCDKIYPGIIWRSSVYKNENLDCVRVEIEYSGDTPHFGGPAWIRKGSESIKASDEMFQRLIESRLGIVRELSKWINKKVTVYGEISTVPKPVFERLSKRDPVITFSHRWEGKDTEAKLIFTNNFWITLERDGEKISEPLKKITLGFDNKNNRLKIIIDY